MRALSKGERPRKGKFRWIAPVVGFSLLASLLFYLNYSPPFMAIASNSMQPALSRGDLILIKNVSLSEVKTGDIIVFRVPTELQGRYGYPPTVCHRIARTLDSATGISFRTKGDNTSEDPFIVLPQDIIGEGTGSIPVAGYLVMFPQSRQGWLFFVGLLILYLCYTQGDNLLKGTYKLRGSVLGISASEFARSQNVMEQKMSLMSGQVEQSLNAFSSAMAEYAKHLASHTSAVQSLAESARHLESVVERNEHSLFESQKPAGPKKPGIKADENIQPDEVGNAIKRATADLVVNYVRASRVIKKETMESVPGNSFIKTNRKPKT